MQTGNIGVTTENIFPVIKKFLYSDEEIFIREIISNAVDATQKLKTLVNAGEYSGETDNLGILVRVNPEDNTITVSDHGIGMTGEEIDKYINQIAFSGAEEFINKFKSDDNGIIGHFGLGFYSSYIVSDNVEIITKSYKDGEPAQHWICDGTPSYTIEECDKAEIGTDIVMHISEDFRETYINEDGMFKLLQKYSRFMPVQITMVYGTPEAEAANEEIPDLSDSSDSSDAAVMEHKAEPQFKLVTDCEALWKKKHSEITDEEYIEFYHKMYPDQNDPLFWIHLNVDYPFNLTGILYFPEVGNNVDIMRNKVYLYCNQVYVTDHVNNILPDYLTLLHGVIDSPDIPLNVSRSYLQGDANVKKIAGYISNKVASELVSRINADRATYEEKWKNIRIFIHYGMLTQEGFYDKVKDALLIQDTDDKYYTLQEYRELIEPNQKDKNGKIVHIYAIDKKNQYSYIEAAKAKGYSVVLLGDNLATPFINMLERENKDISWIRVDSNVISKLIDKGEDSAEVDATDKELLISIFDNLRPDIPESNFTAEVGALGEEELPVLLTANEWSRRVKEMYAGVPGNMFGNMSYSFSMNVNTDAPAVKSLLEKFNKKNGEKWGEYRTQIGEKEAEIASLEKEKESENIASKDEIEGKINSVKATRDDLKKKRDELVKKFAEKSELAKQMVDIALLRVGMLNGESLNAFLLRSAKLLK